MYRDWGNFIGEKQLALFKLFYIKWLQSPSMALEDTSIRKTLGMTEQHKGKEMKLYSQPDVSKTFKWEQHRNHSPSCEAY